jgi:hypothetical protein
MIISAPKVMSSPAGFYIGRSYEDADRPGIDLPYSRDSGYMNRERAEAALEMLKLCQPALFITAEDELQPLDERDTLTPEEVYREVCGRG